MTSSAPSGALSDIDIAAIQCNRILLRLKRISEVPAISIDNSDLARPAADRPNKDAPVRSGKLPSPTRTVSGSIPQSVSLDGPGLSDLDRDHPDFSLYAHYQPKVVGEYERQRRLPADRQDPKRLISLWRMMDRDYAIYVGKLMPEKPITHKAQLEQLFVQCIGFTAEDAADWCETDVAWVVKSRILDRRDVKTGIKKTRSKQIEQIIDKALDGKPLREIAAELGLSFQYVGRVLKGVNA